MNLVPKRNHAVLIVGMLLTVLARVTVAGVVIESRSVSFSDVSSAISSAHDGDTVVVPAGTASWTSTLTIAKGITLQGAGNDTTIILDDVPRPERPKPSLGRRQLQGPEQQQQRQRQWQLQRPGRARLSANAGPLSGRGSLRGGPNRAILRIELAPRQSFRLAGFTFRYGSITSQNQNGAININGTCPSIRVDHCHFDQLYATANVFVDGWLYGVIDHCTFDIRANGGGASVRVYHTTWGNQVSGWGSWADPPYFGSEKFIFVEANVVNNLGLAPERGNIDAQHGGRFVVRYNIFNNCNIFYHGSDNGGGLPHYRGARAVEIYNNTFNATHRVSAGQDRSGPLIWHHNTYTGNYGGGMGLVTYRQFEYEKNGFLGADGTSPWDYNATEPDGTHVDGHSPYTFATGTNTAGTGTTTVTVSGAPWATNQWVGYSITNTNSASPYYHGCNWIASNTSNTLTLGPLTTSLTPKGEFNTGDTFAIHKVLIVLDQPGRGKGDLLRGPNPTPAWPHQALEPCYSWNNTLNGQNLNFTYNATKPLLRENVDFYNNAPMPGYMPYTYPHPLVSSGLATSIVPATPKGRKRPF
jgi:hypothetical protein